MDAIELKVQRKTATACAVAVSLKDRLKSG
jgi:hypothetical protein